MPNINERIYNHGTFYRRPGEVLIWDGSFGFFVVREAGFRYGWGDFIASPGFGAPRVAQNSGGGVATIPNDAALRELLQRGLITQEQFDLSVGRQMPAERAPFTLPEGARWADGSPGLDGDTLIFDVPAVADDAWRVSATERWNAVVREARERDYALLEPSWMTIPDRNFQVVVVFCRPFDTSHVMYKRELAPQEVGRCSQCTRLSPFLELNYRNNWVCNRCGPSMCDRHGRMVMRNTQCRECLGSELNDVYAPLDDGRMECPLCQGRYLSGDIMQHSYTRDGEFHEDASICSECYRTHLCRRCHSVYTFDSGRNTCDPCHEVRMQTDPSYARRHAVETDDQDITFNVERYIYQPAFRRRLTSIELEFNAGRLDGNALADDLSERGLSGASRRVSYHSGMSDWAHVESDGTVSGGEMILRTLNLNSKLGHHVLWSGLDALRRRVKSGDFALGLNAGCHIHVDVSDLSANNLVNLALIVAYIEDPLMRLGAAGWSVHRAHGGSPYKAGWATVSAEDKHSILSSISTRDANSLYLAHTLGIRGNCRCGARRDADQVCECEHLRYSRNTVEFRMFNTTSNPIKLNAYIALTQAMCEYSKRAMLDPDEFPAFDYSPMANVGAVAPAVERRLRFILGELPLTPQERNSIRYCIRNSSLSALQGGVSEETWAFFSQDEEEEPRPLIESTDVWHPTGVLLPPDYVDSHMRRVESIQDAEGRVVPLPTELQYARVDTGGREFAYAQGGPAFVDPEYDDDEYYEDDEYYGDDEGPY